MVRTEKKHWFSGYRKHGASFNSLAGRIAGYGVIFYWGRGLLGKLFFDIKFYKLI